MAITVTGVEVLTAGPAGLPVTTPPFDNGSAGSVVIYTLICTSTISLIGQNLYFNPALFRVATTVELPLIAQPIYGYVGLYPGVFTTTVPMSGLPTPRSNQGNNYIASFTATSATDFTITLSFVFTFDLNDFVTDVAFSPNSQRFIKNNVQAPEILLNDVASVYNETRVLRSAIVTDDLAGTIDGIYHDFEFDARYYEKGLFNGAAEYTNWSYELTRNGEVVTNLSIHDPTTIKFQVDIVNIGTISAVNQFLAYREDSPSAGFGFMNDLNVSVYLSGINFFGAASVLSFIGWTLVSGTVYELTYELDPAYFVLNGRYRFIAVAIEGPDNNGVTNSFITPDLLVVDSPPKATSGTMTGVIEDFNDIFGNCLEVAPFERIRSCVQVDKTSYNAEIITNNTEGTFDTNFDNVRVTLTALVGTLGTVIDVNTNTGDPNLIISDNADFYESCLTFRIQPEWVNTAFALTHTYTYQLEKDGVPYTDIITFEQVINADKLEENELVANQIITGIVFKDSGGNVLTELCADESAPITVEVTKAVTIDDYNLIALIKRDIVGEAPQEEEAYNNNILPLEESDIVDAVDVQFVANVATFEVDPTKLDIGQKYRVYAIAKKVNLTPPAPCPVITIQTDTEVTSTGLVGPDEVTTLGIDFAITSFAPSTVTNVDINSTVSGVNVTGPNQNDNFITDTGSYSYIITFTDGFRGIPADLQLIIDVTLSNGCTYSGRIQLHSILPILGNKTQEITEENGD